VTGGSGTDVCRLRHIQTQFRHATLEQHKLLIEHALLTALQKDLARVIAQASATTKTGKPGTIRRESMVARLADDQGMKAKVGLYAEMRGMRQQEIARSLYTLQQTARTLLDTAAGTAGDESEDDGDDTTGQQAAGVVEPEPVGATATAPGDGPLQASHVKRSGGQVIKTEALPPHDAIEWAIKRRSKSVFRCRDRPQTYVTRVSLNTCVT